MPEYPGLLTKRSALTERETTVMWHVAGGLSNRAIGKALALSPHTIKFHVNNAIHKLDAYTRTDAAVKFVLARPAEAREELGKNTR